MAYELCCIVPCCQGKIGGLENSLPNLLKSSFRLLINTLHLQYLTICDVEAGEPGKVPGVPRKIWDGEGGLGEDRHRRRPRPLRGLLVGVLIRLLRRLAGFLRLGGHQKFASFLPHIHIFNNLYQCTGWSIWSDIRYELCRSFAFLLLFTENS